MVDRNLSLFFYPREFHDVHVVAWRRMVSRRWEV
jgi:hypothetical protein